MISGRTERDIAVKALQAGAQDSYVKGLIDARLLVKAILRQLKKH